MFNLGKKGSGNMIMIMWLFILMVVLFGGIIVGTSIFFGKEYDSRKAESDLLSYQIRKCILEKGDEVFESEKFFEVCGLNKDVVRKNNIIRICEDSKDCIGGEKVKFNVGDNFNLCNIESSKISREFHLCSIKKFDKEGRRFEIIAGSNQASRRLQG